MLKRVSTDGSGSRSFFDIANRVRERLADGGSAPAPFSAAPPAADNGGAAQSLTSSAVDRGVPMGADPVSRALATIRARESGGNYGARNPTSSASGAYQFIDGTWGGYGGYKHAYQAPAHVQDAKARAWVQHILARYPGDVRAVPMTWYTGHYSPSELSCLGADGGSIGAYVRNWLNTYKSFW